MPALSGAGSIAGRAPADKLERAVEPSPARQRRV